MNSVTNSKEYSASITATSSGFSATGVASAIDTSIVSAVALPFKSLAESSEKENRAKDSKSQSSKLAQESTQTAVGVPAGATPLTQIPPHETIDKAIQELSTLFNDNLLEVANSIKFEHLQGLPLAQIIDTSLITLVLAIYQKTSPDKRNLKALLATISDSAHRSYEQSVIARMQKVLIFCKTSAISTVQKVVFESIIKAVENLNKFPQFYQTPYRGPQNPLVAYKNIFGYTREILYQMIQLIIPKMELLLPTLQQNTQDIQTGESKAKRIKDNQQITLKKVVVRDALGYVDEQRDSLVRLSKPLIYFISSYLKVFKHEESSTKLLSESHLIESRSFFHWKFSKKKIKTNLHLLLESLKYEDNIYTYTTGSLLTKESARFCSRLIAESINNQIVFYQSLSNKLLLFKSKCDHEFNANVKTNRAGFISAICLLNVCLRGPSKDPKMLAELLDNQKRLKTVRSTFHQKLLSLVDELNSIMTQCVDEFMKKNTMLFDKRNIYRISSDQNDLFPDDKFLYDLGKFVEVNYLYIRNYFKELADVVIAIGKKQNSDINKNIFDYIIDRVKEKIEKLQSKKIVENFNTTFAEHIESYNCHIVSPDKIKLNQSKNSSIINQINDVLALLNPISETLIPIMDVSRKAIFLSEESQVQSVDYWLESIYDSRGNEIDPLEATEDTEIVIKGTAPKKKSKFKSSKKKAISGISGIAASSAIAPVQVVLQHNLNYPSKAARQFATMRWQLSVYHQLPSHVVVPNALAVKHVEMANVAIQQQIYPAECLQAALEILEKSKHNQDQRLAILSFFLYGQLFLEQSLTGPFLKLSADKKLTHRLSSLLGDLGLKGCEKWMEVNPWDTRCFRYPHTSLQNCKGKVPLALWHATQPSESSIKETTGILDQLVLEAIVLQQGLQKQSALNSSNETAAAKPNSSTPVEAVLKEARAGYQTKLGKLQLTIGKFLLPLKDFVKKMSESTFDEKKIKNALKDVECQLQNLHDLLGLVMRHGEQRFLFLHANIAMLSTQYFAENLGAYLSLLAGDEMRDHNLMAYCSCFDLGANLSESDFETLQDINIRKGSEYLFQYFNNRHLSKISPRMHYLSGLYATSSLAIKEREGFVVDKSSCLSLEAQHEEFYKFLEPLVRLAINLVNHHVLKREL